MFLTCTCNIFYLGILLIIWPLEYDSSSFVNLVYEKDNDFR